MLNTKFLFSNNKIKYQEIIIIKIQEVLFGKMKTTLLIAIIISAALLITLAADVNKEPETFYTAFDQAQSPLVLRVPNSKLAGISEYGFSLWIKFSHFSPKFMFPAWVRDRWMGIAHVTEKEHTCSNNW